MLTLLWTIKSTEYMYHVCCCNIFIYYSDVTYIFIIIHKYIITIPSQKGLISHFEHNSNIYAWSNKQIYYSCYLSEHFFKIMKYIFNNSYFKNTIKFKNIFKWFSTMCVSHLVEKSSNIYLISTKNTQYPIYWLASEYVSSTLLAQVIKGT